MKISVICPTIRKDGLTIVKNALSKQTFKEFEFLIGSPFDPKIPEARWILDDFRDGFWSLNRIYNRLFQACSGDLIVSLQDWIYVNPDGLQKFWDNYQKTKGIISGVGDQYESINKWGKPQVKIWSDPRKTDKYGSFYECEWNDAEWNWCAIPKKEIFAVGGMDEELDFLGYGGDQMSIAQRMRANGVLSYLDQTNESYTVRHDREDFGGQEKWDTNHVLFNGKYKQRMGELLQSGKYPCIGYI